MFISKFVLLIVGLSCISYSAQESPLRVVLYYEGLCPGCHEFILEQLYPGYQKLGDSFLIDLVPFGGASATKTDDGWQWECQHGPLECYINKVDACLTSFEPTQSQLISFVNCHTKNTSMDITFDETEDIIKQCAEENNVSFYDIRKCVTSGRADTLLLALQDRQNKLVPKLEYVPSIRFNDVYDEDLDNVAIFDFVYAVCSLLNGTKPSACDDIEFKNVKNLNKPHNLLI
ncbi:unnamed protein product [Psylliodes chrysocephalus]|uniref:Gamma-interferon-inducible lysosomal thiol reductase n=1 Tax=Psylliodes chrysocephalus TaxID=3402493 RepID=A0A9P0CXC5_9CUCU|nr:unnamed protein product [Psylliodes chrysocephala]